MSEVNAAREEYNAGRMTRCEFVAIILAAEFPETHKENANA